MKMTGMLATLAVALVPGARPLHAQAPAYAVAPVRSDWDEARTVGHHGSGVFCVPLGTIAWKQVMPDPARAAERIARTLKAAGMDVVVADADDPPAAARYRIVARIVDLRMKACTPHFGVVRMLGGNALRGDGHLTVAWHVRDGVDRTDGPTQTITTDFVFGRSDRTLADALLTGLDADAVLFAQASRVPVK